MKRKKIVKPEELEQLTELEIFQKTTEGLLKLCIEMIDNNRKTSDKLLDIAIEYNNAQKKHAPIFEELVNLRNEGLRRGIQKRQMIIDAIEQATKNHEP